MRYKYNVGIDGPKGYINSIEEIPDLDDCLDIFRSLTIQRTDQMEMNKDEIEDIRKDFFNVSDTEELLCCGSVDSYHKDKKLYFFVHDRDYEEASCEPISEEEFLRFIHESFRLCFMYGDHKLIKRNLGFDLIYQGLKDECATPDTPDIALVCIYDFNHVDERFGNRSITEEELRDILQNTIDYKNREIILYLVELVEDAKEYAKDQNVDVKTTMDIMKDRKMLESKLNDINLNDLPIPNVKPEELEKIRKWLSEELRRFEPKL